MELESFKKKVLPLREKLEVIAQRFVQDKEDAEDIVQDTFLKLWAIRDKLEQYNSIEALAVQIAKNKALDFLRSKRNTHFEDLENLGQSTDKTPEKITEEQDAIETIRRIVSGLPAIQQTIIRMKDIEGYEIAEIAEITGTKVETVRVNLSRARKKVRDIFIKYNKGRYEN